MNKKIIYSVIFATGACVLIIEITALRILSPYFGNTIYSSSSVISVVLAALSIGYYFGGKLADVKKSFKYFFVIIMLGGLSVFVLNIVYQLYLAKLSQMFSYIWGPIVSSTFLFFPSALLLGMLSPYAIGLVSESDKKHVGSVSGNIFFFSTLGSIVGSLITGFYLIPHFGVDRIIFSVSVILSAIGFIGIISFPLKKKLTNLILFSLLFFSCVAYLSNEYITFDGVVYSEDGVYGRIVFKDEVINGRDVRYFYHDKNSSSAIYRDSGEHFYEYTKYYKLYDVFPIKLQNALVIGGGAYTIPNSLVNETEAFVDVLEIEPDLYELSKKYFGLADNSRIENYVIDGRRFLTYSEKKYDYIFSDVYQAFASMPSHFTTKEFFTLTRDRLTTDGIIIINVIGHISREKPNYLMSQIKTFKSVYPNSYYFATNSSSSYLPQNIIFVGVNGDKKLTAQKMKEYIVNGNESLEEKYISLSRFSFEDQLLLTDNYAPVEMLAGKTISKYFSEDNQVVFGDEALGTVEQIVSLGPRIADSDAKEDLRQLIKAEMNVQTDTVISQKWEKDSFDFENIIARVSPETEMRVILATNYDSKRYASREKTDDKKRKSSIAASDSASGVAMLFEIARALVASNEKLSYGVDFVFFDGSEGISDYTGESWYPVGSSYFMDNIANIYPGKLPEEAIVIQGICDRDLDIFPEGNSYESTKEAMQKFWEIGQKKYPSNFGNEVKFTVLGDHKILSSHGIPSFLVTDYDYSEREKLSDTADKCSAKSFEKVGEVVLEYLSLR